ncbi:DUF2065 family protein [Amaricoccus solimangrovi]|uniref:DUF2065 domain-containing protein n=1 Tax=Amaricoccus solimangrovi TaxID=2589815 RepID=A0A501WW97_9RHOB|nr:DUF2065 family protein [Amaricoccus solimangrovi]TPE53549.1 DUF2065 domain-containing protein [Amaricoccus solimangrovi]
MLGSPLQLILWGLGVAAVLEGLVLALAPRHLGAVLELLSRLDMTRRREIGLAVLAVGVMLMWLAHA